MPIEPVLGSSGRAEGTGPAGNDRSQVADRGPAHRLLDRVERGHWYRGEVVSVEVRQEED